MIPGGLHRNRDFRAHMVTVDRSVPDYLADILFDPQTSGGLLISVSSEKADGLLARMHREGIPEAVIIGEVIAEPKGKIIVD
jgi:selenide,water dikinase